MFNRSMVVASVAVALGYSVSARAEDAGMVKDLAATIALHGQPCDKVVEAQRNGDSDYTARCQDGNRYRVHVDAGGRVVVTKL